MVLISDLKIGFGSRDFISIRLKMFEPKILWAGVSEKLSGGEMGRQLVTAEMAAMRVAAWVVPAFGLLAAEAEPLPLEEIAGV
jgi:hypothetical protein